MSFIVAEVLLLNIIIINICANIKKNTTSNSSIG